MNRLGLIIILIFSIFKVKAQEDWKLKDSIRNDLKLELSFEKDSTFSYLEVFEVEEKEVKPSSGICFGGGETEETKVLIEKEEDLLIITVYRGSQELRSVGVLDNKIVLYTDFESGLEQGMLNGAVLIKETAED